MVAGRSTMRHRLGAVLVNAGRVLNVGWNQERHNPNHFGAWSLHAELDACLGCSSPVDGCELYVCRVLRTPGTVGNARPCEPCAERLRSLRLRRVAYTVATEPLTSTPVFGVLNLRA